MIQHPYLIPECNVDTVFVEMLGYPEPNHAANINQVCSALEKLSPNQRAIGFIDNDKKKPDYLDQFEPLDEVNNIQLLKHSGKSQYLVVAKPAMDMIVYDLCRNLNIDISKYKLPSAFKPFKERTKSVSIRQDKNFKNLLNTIKQKHPPEIEKIKSWIVKYSPYTD